MGRASRWLMKLLGGGKKEKRSGGGRRVDGDIGDEERRDRRRWSFTKSGRDHAYDPGVAAAVAAEEAAWLKALYAESEKEQSKHAIKVAAATAAAADAAVAAAQAAVAVVRLTSRGGGALVIGSGERLAAVRIQTAFRGYLAKKARRALRALVKLQALVRGYLVRKQAAATLHSMQSLIRAQATVRAYKSRMVLAADPRRSMEDARSEQAAAGRAALSASLDSSSDRSPRTVEIDTYPPRSRSSRRTSPPDDLPPPFTSSPLPPRISIPDCRSYPEFDWYLPDKCRAVATAQSTPRYLTGGGGGGMPPSLTPAKSVCAADGVFRRFINGGQNEPSYMAMTQSFGAKLRSQSAPRQRPEAFGGPRKRLPLAEMMMESRASMSGAFGVQRSSSNYSSQIGEAAAFDFKAAVVGRLDRSAEFVGREIERDLLYSQRRW